MDKPDLTKMWRTWIKIGPWDQLTRKMLQDTIRQKLLRIAQLQEMGAIAWYYFLCHRKGDDPAHAHFDIVFTTAHEDPQEVLPDYCIETKKIPPITEIGGIDATLLKGHDIAEAWRIIGEQSAFIINFVLAHTETSEITLSQITQFMHFFMNPLMLGNKSVLFDPQIPPATRSQLLKMPKGTYFPF